MPVHDVLLVGAVPAQGTGPLLAGVPPEDSARGYADGKLAATARTRRGPLRNS